MDNTIVLYRKIHVNEKTKHVTLPGGGYWTRVLDEDVRVVVGRLGKQFEKTCPWIAQLRLVVKSINSDGRVQIVIGYGDAPKGELVCINVAEVVRLLSLDELLEIADCPGWIIFDRECVGRSLSINKTEQAHAVVGHGVAKQKMKRKMKKAGDKRR